MKKIILCCSAIMLSVVLAFSISAKTVKLGDVTADDKITASDARKILRIAATLDTCDDETKAVADVTGDDKITASDARKVLRAAAQMEADLGTLTIGEEVSSEETEVEEEIEEDDVIRTEVMDAIGMNVANFLKHYGDMIKDGTSDGTTMYHNDYLIIVSDPKMIDDLKINSITVTGGDYTLNGVYAGMSAESAEKLLVADGWKVKNSSATVVVFEKNSGLMNLTVKSGKVVQAELCLATSIATNAPSEPVTQAPVTDNNTETEKPQKPQNNADVLAGLPVQVRNFLQGNFGFTGKIISGEDVNNVTIYTNGDDMSIDLSVDISEGEYMDLRVLICQNEGKDPDMYLINPTKGTYITFDPALIGGSMSDFKLNVDVGDISEAVITTENTKNYVVYRVTTPTGVTLINTINGEIKTVESFDHNNTYQSRIEIEKFYSEFSADLLNVKTYKKTSLLSFFSEDFGISLDDLISF